VQNLQETIESIMKLGNVIGKSDCTSALFNERRIASMRAFLDNFERLNATPCESSDRASTAQGIVEGGSE